MHERTVSQRLKTPKGIAGLTILVFFIVIAAAAPLLAPYGPSDISSQPLLPPDIDHPLGTDDVGRDIFTELLYGSRTSLTVAFVVSFGVLVIGTLGGVFSGYVGGTFDRVLMRGVDIFLMIPDLPLILILAAYLRPNIWNIIFILIIMGWPVGARVTRAQTRSLRVSGHVDFARVSGAGPWYVVRKHIVPDLYPIMVTSIVMQSIRAILSESGLAFLGLGDPSYPSWGTMIKYAIAYPMIFFTDAWMWWLLPAGMCITLLVLGFVLLGQSLEGDY
ncbi:MULTISPECIES: ABC transporter permease [unclassified Methanosarcina]|uniref:ABC transporter permease n=1 Tax=unclassified Methanosarcina TaxID=2644672 RepID=UPI00061570D7|nr:MULTISPECIES: ABC transporter permease [unclassified Methanosarcina]AKB16911.1 Oligopeptide transport system permease protein OppC [Methanosarcina sp. WWM596]AKB20316.1 Oligopeptide transport system permease protein OppC [Methanosarcina sp. WH1]